MIPECERPDFNRPLKISKQPADKIVDLRGVRVLVDCLPQKVGWTATHRQKWLNAMTAMVDCVYDVYK